MATCPRPARVRPYYPGGRCPEDAPRAEDATWTVFDNAANRNPVGPGGEGQYAEKVVGSVTISGHLRYRGSVAARFAQPPAYPVGSRNPNAVTVLQQRIGGNSAANMEFYVSVPQPAIRMQVMDLDAANDETFAIGFVGAADAVPTFSFGNHYPARPADRIIATQVPTGAPFGIQYVPPGVARPGYKSQTINGIRRSETSGVLVWEDAPWGPAQPVRAAFVLSSGSNQRGSQYDFWGQIQQAECDRYPRHAALICRHGTFRWRDVVTGDPLTEAELETMEWP